MTFTVELIDYDLTSIPEPHRRMAEGLFECAWHNCRKLSVAVYRVSGPSAATWNIGACALHRKYIAESRFNNLRQSLSAWPEVWFSAA